ncbi:MAG TPA: hypothetical protein VI072_31975, partial [Polyangiaceae bacterium]
AVIELVDLPALRRLFDLPTRQARRTFGVAARPAFIAAIAALGGVLIFDTLPGLFIGIGVSMLLLLYRSSQPNISTLGQLPDGRFTDLERDAEAKTVDGIRPSVRERDRSPATTLSRERSVGCWDFMPKG